MRYDAVVLQVGFAGSRPLGHVDFNFYCKPNCQVLSKDEVFLGLVGKHSQKAFLLMTSWSRIFHSGYSK